jgi:hypothetical protein
MRELDAALDGVNLIDEASERGAGHEAGGDEELVIVEGAHEPRLGFMRDGRPELHPLTWICERRWHDADDRVLVCVEPDGFADDGRIGGEAALPEGVREDGGGLRGGLIVRDEEVAAKRGGDAEDAEEIRGDPGSADGFRQLGAAGGDIVALPGRDEGQLRGAARSALPLGEGAGGDRVPGRGAVADSVAFVERDEARGVWIRERVEQYGADDGEERGGGADAERHDENGSEGEARGAGKSAEGVFEIAQDAFEKRDAVLLPELFMDAALGAEADAGVAIGFFRAEAAGDVFCAFLLDVLGDLAGEVAGAAAAVEETMPAHSATSFAA